MLYKCFPFAKKNEISEKIALYYELLPNNILNQPCPIILKNDKQIVTSVYYLTENADHSLIEKWQEQNYSNLPYVIQLSSNNLLLKILYYNSSHKLTHWALVTLSGSGNIFTDQLHDAEDKLVEYNTYKYDENDELLSQTIFLAQAQVLDVIDYS
jgi:hypothetical protein